MYTQPLERCEKWKAWFVFCMHSLKYFPRTSLSTCFAPKLRMEQSGPWRPREFLPPVVRPLRAECRHLSAILIVSSTLFTVAEVSEGDALINSVPVRLTHANTRTLRIHKRCTHAYTHTPTCWCSASPCVLLLRLEKPLFSLAPLRWGRCVCVCVVGEITSSHFHICSAVTSATNVNDL